jgi:hypothetical protein
MDKQDTNTGDAEGSIQRMFGFVTITKIPFKITDHFISKLVKQNKEIIRANTLYSLQLRKAKSDLESCRQENIALAYRLSKMSMKMNKLEQEEAFLVRRTNSNYMQKLHQSFYNLAASMRNTADLLDACESRLWNSPKADIDLVYGMDTMKSSESNLSITRTQEIVKTTHLSSLMRLPLTKLVHLVLSFIKNLNQRERKHFTPTLDPINEVEERTENTKRSCQTESKRERRGVRINYKLPSNRM